MTSEDEQKAFSFGQAEICYVNGKRKRLHLAALCADGVSDSLRRSEKWMVWKIIHPLQIFTGTTRSLRFSLFKLEAASQPQNFSHILLWCHVKIQVASFLNLHR